MITDFDKAILNLHSRNKVQIEMTIAKATHREHFSLFGGDENILGIHTGVYFETHKRTPMELIYCLGTKELIFQKRAINNHSYSPQLGEVMHWCFTQHNQTDYGRFVSYEDKGFGEFYIIWHICYYNVLSKEFAPPQKFSVQSRKNTLPFFLKGEKSISLTNREYLGTLKI